MEYESARHVTSLNGKDWPFPWPDVFEQQPLHRYTRHHESGTAQVDFLIADHVAPRILAQLPEPTPVQAPGGSNALQRTQEFEVIDVNGTSRISSPDLPGALVLKIEVYAADSRDRERHLRDAVTLAALLNEDTWGSPLHGQGISRMRRLITWLNDSHRIGRAGIPADDASNAIFALEDLLEPQSDRS